MQNILVDSLDDMRKNSRQNLYFKIMAVRFTSQLGEFITSKTDGLDETLLLLVQQNHRT